MRINLVIYFFVLLQLALGDGSAQSTTFLNTEQLIESAHEHVNEGKVIFNDAPLTWTNLTVKSLTHNFEHDPKVSITVAIVDSIQRKMVSNVTVEISNELEIYMNELGIFSGQGLPREREDTVIIIGSEQEQSSLPVTRSEP